MTEREMSQFIMDNEGLIRAVFNKYRRSIRFMRLEDEDVYQELRIALWRAKETHDPAKAPFPVYATICIRKALFELFKSTGRHIENTAEVMGIEVGNSRDTTLVDLLPAHFGPRLDSAEDVDEEKHTIATITTNALLEHCPKRDARILRKQSEGYTTREIAEEEGVSQQRIAQLSARGKRQIRRAMQEAECPKA